MFKMWNVLKLTKKVAILGYNSLKFALLLLLLFVF